MAAGTPVSHTAFDSYLNSITQKLRSASVSIPDPALIRTQPLFETWLLLMIYCSYPRLLFEPSLYLSPAFIRTYTVGRYGYHVISTAEVPIGWVSLQTKICSHLLLHELDPGSTHNSKLLCHDCCELVSPCLYQPGSSEWEN